MPLPAAVALPILPAAISKFTSILFVLFSVLLFQIVLKVLIVIGVSFVTTTGFDGLFDNLIQLIQTNIGGLPSQMVTILGIAKVDKAVTVILSGYAIKLALDGTNSVTRMVLQPQTT